MHTQEIGETVLGGLYSVCEELARRQQPTENGQPQLTQAQELEQAKETAVYFDILGYHMVSVSDTHTHAHAHSYAHTRRTQG